MCPCGSGGKIVQTLCILAQRIPLSGHCLKISKGLPTQVSLVAACCQCCIPLRGQGGDLGILGGSSCIPCLPRHPVALGIKSKWAPIKKTFTARRCFLIHF